MIATSIMSLSLEPLSLIVCVNRTSRSGAAFLASDVFSANALRLEQIDVARSFGPDIEREGRFKTGRWRTSRGAPVLRGAQANFVCRRTQSIAYGTHDILVGDLLSAHANAAARPLVYLDGIYTACGPPPPAACAWPSH